MTTTQNTQLENLIGARKDLMRHKEELIKDIQELTMDFNNFVQKGLAVNFNTTFEFSHFTTKLQMGFEELAGVENRIINITRVINSLVE